MVKIIASTAEWHEAIKGEGKKAVIVDFTATWCGPCQMIGPVFEELSGKYDTVLFLKVDVDAQTEVAALCNISSMPTFQVFQNGAKVDQMIGANKASLTALVEKYA